ncbi:acyclic terpene utilization AtuA family protein, partial [Streptomyces sp. NPDC055078]
ADAVRVLLERKNAELTVAYVDGDDILPRLPGLQAAGHRIEHLHTGLPLSSWAYEPLSANAYLGGFGVARALAGGADIVVTGRVADASVVTGAAAWWWDWKQDDHHALAGAMAAGHVIECGPQATGGNFSGFRSVPGLDGRPGFPIAEIDADGSSVITKHPGTDGMVTADTVIAQLLYEVGSPAYLNSDVVTHLDTVHIEDLGGDRVRISGTRGTPPPPTTKVAVTALGGWRNSGTFVLTGLDVDEKAALVERTVRARFAGVPGIDKLTFTRIGTPAEDPKTQWAGTSLLEICVQGTEKAAGRAFSDILVEMSLANYPGPYQTARPGRGSSYGTYWPGLIGQDELRHRVVHADGREEFVPSPPHRAEPAGRAEAALVPARSKPVAESTTVVALGRIAHARSGDKGGDANVGVWVTDDEVWEWLRSALDIPAFRQLMPDSEGLEVFRYELPNLRALNFVVRDLLGAGATSTVRPDRSAKALGEWLRARHLPVPHRLLDRYTL